MNDIFDKARTVTAKDVAEREGLRLTQRGQRFWACCPLHQEKTASLCLYPDGGWHCFGCAAGGADGASFLAALRGISQLEAARELAEGVTGPVRGEAAARAFLRRLERWRGAELSRLNGLAGALERRAVATMEGVGIDDPFPAAYVQAIRLRTEMLWATAEVEGASVEGLHRMMAGRDADGLQRPAS